MTKLDPNRLVLVVAVVVLVIVAAVSGYRLHIGRDGLTFERGAGANISANHFADGPAQAALQD